MQKMWLTHILPFMFVTLEFIQLRSSNNTQRTTMGGRQSRSKLPVEDMEFLVHNTRWGFSGVGGGGGGGGYDDDGGGGGDGH